MVRGDVFENVFEIQGQRHPQILAQDTLTIQFFFVSERMNFDEALGFLLDADVFFQFGRQFDSLGQRCQPHRSCRSKSPV